MFSNWAICGVFILIFTYAYTVEWQNQNVRKRENAEIRTIDRSDFRQIDQVWFSDVQTSNASLDHFI